MMKDLGTAAVLACSITNVVAFYPDGAWWTPCIMEHNARLLEVADSLGVPESFCPVRAMLGAFVTRDRFPIPDLLVCGVGATCDDFSAIAQRLSGMGHPIVWWEMPHRRPPEPGEPAVGLPGGGVAPTEQVAIVEAELRRIGQAIAAAAGQRFDENLIAAGIRRGNAIRAMLDELRTMVFTADPCPMPALEMLIAEMLAIHYCSDRNETDQVLLELRGEVERRVRSGMGVLPPDAVRVFWVNPVADLRVMNLVEDVGGRICGTDYMFTHALDAIPEDCPPMEALARTALADSMAGPVSQRADRICRDAARFGSQAVLVSRIPGASHCATEGAIIAEIVRSRLDLPVIEIEVPSNTDAIEPGLCTRLQALVETARGRHA
ncbi:MAG: 2-hydroxyacyl-CoA dehydratase [Planctomycetes bacterium]|nr:2-hydroxyacyl-CoA dehydratase [Planctomycetota bacterium]